MSEGKKFCAVYAMVKNEINFLPLWIKYYSNLFGMENLYLLDHQSNDGSTENLGCNIEVVENTQMHDNAWMIYQVVKKQAELLEKYDYVISVDVDEFIIPDPNKYENLYEYVSRTKPNVVRCVGYEVVHQRHQELNVLDWNKPILVHQRKYWINLETYNKPLIGSRPIKWTQGKHYEIGRKSDPTDNDLILCHLHRIDYEAAKIKAIKERAYVKESVKDYWPNTMIDDNFNNYFDDPQHIRFGCLEGTLTEIPERFKGIL